MPGSGKSTFCRWVAWLMCNGKLPPQQVEPPPECTECFPETLRDHLPVLLRLREFWASLPEIPAGRELSPEQLEQVLSRWWHGKKPTHCAWEWPNLLAHLRQGTAFLILDGVDEVPLTTGEGRHTSQPRALLLAGLTAAIPDWLSAGNRVLLTSRPYGVRETESRKLALRPAPIDDLALPGQQLLVRRWFHILADNPAAGAATAQEMLDHLSGRVELEPLAANPMLLTAMCIIYHQGKRLPQDRYDLYTRILDLVLYNRYHYDPAVLDLVRNRLSVLAHGMHTGAGLDEDRTTPQAEATYAELDHMLQAYQDQSAWSEAGFKTALDTREELLSHTGLLLPRGDRRAGFYHLSIQEFLAAQRLLDVAGESDRLFEVFRRGGLSPSGATRSPSCSLPSWARALRPSVASGCWAASSKKAWPSRSAWRWWWPSASRCCSAARCAYGRSWRRHSARFAWRPSSARNPSASAVCWDWPWGSSAIPASSETCAIPPGTLRSRLEITSLAKSADRSR